MEKKIVFVGDSITASYRDDGESPLGYGYVSIVAEELGSQYHFLNRGVNADRITDLEARWEKDVIDEHPQILSISIGINDVWRQLDSYGVKQTYPEEFEALYNQLLEEVKQHGNAEIILMEPTIIEEDPHSDGNKLLRPYVEVVRKVAKVHDCTLIPLHSVFIDHISKKNAKKLTVDGVHMNRHGNELMAEVWLDHTKHLFRQ